MEYNVYCDESCHLENDKSPIMVLGCLWLPQELSIKVSSEIRSLKYKHGISPFAETKWNRVSKSKLDYYLALIDYFFDSQLLHFRCLVADKTTLRHADFDQDHDTWYYKMYFDLLKIVLRPDDQYFIYLDIKDTRGGFKIRKLHEVLCNAQYDFNRHILHRMQLVRSHEVQQVQLADLLTGAVSYANRQLSTSPAKTSIVKRIKEKTGYSLMKTTLPTEAKFNIFVWKGKRG